MDVIKDLLIKYWKYILFGLYVLLLITLRLIQKKPVKVVDLIAKCVYELIPGYINLVETDSTIKGIRKKEKCLEYIESWFKTNNFEFTSYYKKLASDAIEAILSTPQKHEINK